MDLGPLPGDPALVAAQATAMAAAADQMVAAARTLLALAGTGDFESDATDALRTNATEVATTLTAASSRYRGAAEALAAYAPQLAQAQHQADLARAAAAGTDVWGSGVHAAAAAAEAAVPTLDPSVRAERHAEAVRAASAAKAELARLAAARRQYDDAQRLVDEAGRAAAAKVDYAIRVSKLNDSFWDDVYGEKSWLVPLLTKIKDVADLVSTVLAAVAVVLTVVSLFVPVLAPVLAPIATAAALLSTALSVVSALAGLGLAAFGEGTWGAAIGTALLTAATLGRGVALKKVLGKAVETKKVATVEEAAGDAKVFNPLRQRPAKDQFPLFKEELELIHDVRDLAGDKVEDVFGEPAQVAFEVLTSPDVAIAHMGSLLSGAAIDAAFPPEEAWTVDDSVTIDVSGLGDVQGVDAQSVVDRAFAGVELAGSEAAGSCVVLTAAGSQAAPVPVAAGGGGSW